MQEIDTKHFHLIAGAGNLPTTAAAMAASTTTAATRTGAGHPIRDSTASTPRRIALTA